MMNESTALKSRLIKTGMLISLGLGSLSSDTAVDVHEILNSDTHGGRKITQAAQDFFNCREELFSTRTSWICSGILNWGKR